MRKFKKVLCTTIVGEVHHNEYLDLGTKNDARMVGQKILNLLRENKVNMVFVYARDREIEPAS